MSMYTLKTNIEKKEYIIKKSKFITYIYNISNIEDIEKILNSLKIEYKDATHICYAYIIDNKKKYFDDNEPNKTAGFPILNILEKKKIDNVLAIVIRYFGGIKLGAGGLIRAYSNSIKDSINNNNLEKKTEKSIYYLTTTYENLKKLNDATRNVKIIDKIFDVDIIYTIEIDIEDEEEFIKKINKLNISIKQ